MGTQPTTSLDWKYLPPNYKDYLGFVYKITNKTNGKFYIGKKLFWFKKKTKVAGKKRKKVVMVESDWKDYYGSSNDLANDVNILGRESFTREIIGCYKTKWDMSYIELLMQLRYNVMSPNTNTYNGIINVRLRKRKNG